MFNTLKSHFDRGTYPSLSRPSKCYIVYRDASDDACGAQLSQEHNGQELPVAFLSHTFTDTQQKWSTHQTGSLWSLLCCNKVELLSTGIHDIVVHNDHKPLQKFLNGKNATNKVNRWSLELATYDITFEWISGAHSKAADCLS